MRLVLLLMMMAAALDRLLFCSFELRLAPFLLLLLSFSFDVAICGTRKVVVVVVVDDAVVKINDDVDDSDDVVDALF